MDLFATCLNHQVPQYVACYLDPGALATNAFLQDWSCWTVFIHPPPNSIDPKNSHAKESRQGNRATNCPTLAQPTLVSQSYGDVGVLFSTITSSPSDNSPSIHHRGTTLIVENPAISGMANFRSRLETAGLPEEVCQVIMAGSTQQRYEGPWKVWMSWYVQQQKCPFSAL